MVYVTRRVWLDCQGNICRESRRRKLHNAPEGYQIGGLYLLRPGELYRVEGVGESSAEAMASARAEAKEGAR